MHGLLTIDRLSKQVGRAESGAGLSRTPVEGQT